MQIRILGLLCASALLALTGCGGLDDPSSGGAAFSGKGEGGKDQAWSDDPEYARYDLSFDGWLFRSSHILYQEASFRGSFYLAKTVRHGQRAIRDFSFALELGKGDLKRFQPFTVRSKEDSGSYSDGELGRQDERVELILEAVPLLEEGIEDTILEKLGQLSYPVLQLQVYCNRNTTERFVEDPGFHSCNLGCILSGFWNGSVSWFDPYYHLVAKGAEGCGPVELVRGGDSGSK